MGEASTATPTLKVINNTPSFPRLCRYDDGSFSDLVGTKPGAASPIVCGIWNCDDRTAHTKVFEATCDEVKYVIQGESVWVDVETGVEFNANAGSTIWLPKGSRSILRSCKNLSAFYVEQDCRPPSALEVEDTLWLQSLAELHSQLQGQYVEANPKSKAVFDEALKYLPGGNTRSVLHYDPFPMAFSSGRSCYVTSKDNREYLDCVSEYSAAMFGHSHPEILSSIQNTASSGINLGGPGEGEVELAKQIVTRFHSIDKVRFCNSGTEANMMALQLAQFVTGRSKVLVFENGYHGGFLSFTPKRNPLNVPHDFVFGRYNDIGYTKTLVNGDIAAILVEPMQGAGGMIPGTREFLQFLRDAATEHGIILIFDEVITSRLHINGMQGYHSVYPDMTTLGKYIGGGFSFGAFGGRASIMDRIGSGAGSLFHSGTYNNNVFSMTAGVVAGKLLTESKILKANALGDGLRRGINNSVKMYKIQLMEATGFGSAIGIQFLGESRDMLRDAFFFFLLSKGIYVGKRGFISLGIMHEQGHIDLVLEAVGMFLEKVFGHAKF